MSKPKQLKIHPIALMVPSMSAEAFEALKSDIAANGMRERIWVKDGQIVDGRHRYKAARELGIAFETVDDYPPGKVRPPRAWPAAPSKEVA